MSSTQIVNYKVTIDAPWTHYVKISGNFLYTGDDDQFFLYLPTWSPGSYLVREYSRHIRKVTITLNSGKHLYFEKAEKNKWLVDRKLNEEKLKGQKIHFEYEVYCNEISVRTSHINLGHAFLHGPSLFMSIEGYENCEAEVDITFPPCWTKLNTSLEDISPSREIFKYKAKNYDELLDSPIEIGNQFTDGVQVSGVNHYFVWMGLPKKIYGDLKKDLKVIIERITDFWGEIPFESYTFIGHFFPNKFGGIEHLNSTAVHYDPIKLGTEKGYKNFLSLLAHEYFHAWNVKRVRPIELGPFNYSKENYTRMHWLTEGFTSFVDDLFVFNSGITNEEDYLDVLKKKFNFYLDSPGKYFDSLEEASFDAWIKLYRPHENLKNISVNYYLNGALCFFCLNSLLYLQGRSIKEFAHHLWQRYLQDKSKGIQKFEVLQIIENLAGKSVADEFDHLLTSTVEFPLEESAKRCGLELVWKKSEKLNWGFDWREKEGNLFVSNIQLDGPGFKAGLNNEDEILAVGGMRITKNNYLDWQETLKENETLDFLINRLGYLLQIDVTLGYPKKEIENIKVVNKNDFIGSLSL